MSEKELKVQKALGTLNLKTYLSVRGLPCKTSEEAFTIIQNHDVNTIDVLDFCKFILAVKVYCALTRDSSPSPLYLICAEYNITLTTLSHMAAQVDTDSVPMTNIEKLLFEYKTI